MNTEGFAMLTYEEAETNNTFNNGNYIGDIMFIANTSEEAIQGVDNLTKEYISADLDRLVLDKLKLELTVLSERSKSLLSDLENSNFTEFPDKIHALYDKSGSAMDFVRDLKNSAWYFPEPFNITK